MARKPDNRHAIIGGRHRASSRYAMIKYRLSHTDKPKNSNYAGVELRVSREDFILWFQKHDFVGASVDRKNNTGHYELANMQLIPLSDNIAKEKLKSRNGQCECYLCHQTKPLEEFSRDKRRQSGRKTCCRVCDNAYHVESPREYSQKKKAAA